MKKFEYKSIEDTDILNNTELDEVEAGTCSAGCKKSCHDGNSNRRGITVTASDGTHSVKISAEERKNMDIESITNL